VALDSSITTHHEAPAFPVSSPIQIPPNRRCTSNDFPDYQKVVAASSAFQSVTGSQDQILVGPDFLRIFNRPTNHESPVRLETPARRPQRRSPQARMFDPERADRIPAYRRSSAWGPAEPGSRPSAAGSAPTVPWGTYHGRFHHPALDFGLVLA
jgi:hypothetical protein